MELITFAILHIFLLGLPKDCKGIKSYLW